MAIEYICNTCGGNNVTVDAWAKWSVRKQDWVLADTYDHSHCHDCECETRLIERELEAAG